MCDSKEGSCNRKSINKALSNLGMALPSHDDLAASNNNLTLSQQELNNLKIALRDVFLLGLKIDDLTLEKNSDSDEENFASRYDYIYQYGTQLAKAASTLIQIGGQQKIDAGSDGIKALKKNSKSDLEDLLDKLDEDISRLLDVVESYCNTCK